MRKPGGLWRHRDFLSLWGAETISQFGTQVSLLALPLVAILVLEESAFKIAALTSVEFLPFLLFTLPAGVWVDRLRRKPILVLGNVGRAVALLSVPIVYWVGGLTIWQLYVVGFVVGICTVFFDVAYQSYIPALVGREDVVEANSKLEISRAAAQHRRPGHGRRPHRTAHRPGRRARRRGQLRGLGRAARSGSASRRRRRRAPSAGRSGTSSVRASATSSGIPTSGRWWR